MPPLSPLAPRYVADLFAPLHGELMALLRGLAAADWERPTVAGAWRVRDIAAQLLDGDLRKLAGRRPLPRRAAFAHALGDGLIDPLT